MIRQRQPFQADGFRPRDQLLRGEQPIRIARMGMKIKGHSDSPLLIRYKFNLCPQRSQVRKEAGVRLPYMFSPV